MRRRRVAVGDLRRPCTGLPRTAASRAAVAAGVQPPAAGSSPRSVDLMPLVPDADHRARRPDRRRRPERPRGGALRRPADRRAALALRGLRRAPVYPPAPLLPARRAEASARPTCPAVILVPPMMLAADVYDVSPSSSAVTLLHEHGVEPWVVDFGAPEKEEGGLERSLTDHVLAVSEAIDLVAAEAGRDVHIGGYSPGRDVLLPGRRLPPQRGDRQRRSSSAARSTRAAR